MILEQHIEELRAELRNRCDRKEYRETKAMLDAALAELDARLNAQDALLRNEFPPS